MIARLRRRLVPSATRAYVAAEIDRRIRPLHTTVAELRDELAEIRRLVDPDGAVAVEEFARRYKEVTELERLIDA